MGTPQATTPASFFPFEQIRPKQEKALEFIGRAYDRGYRDVVIAAPTGIGKTGIGVAVCHWAAATFNSPSAPGGYYLTSQKLLQDQIEKDFARFKHGSNASLKSASAYPCRQHGNCGAKGKKECRHSDHCPYLMAKSAFAAAHLGVTNYAYFFTSREFVEDFLVKRHLIVADECHNLEREIIRHVDIKVNEELFEKWAPGLSRVPKLRDLSEFVDWLADVYYPEIKARRDAFIQLAESDTSMADDAAELDKHVIKVRRALDLINEDPSDWVFWKESGKNDKDTYIARPIEAGPFAPKMLFEGADMRIYMSAYPGEREIYCRSLGLKSKDVAWASYGSTFEADKRPIVVFGCGSMSLRNVEDSTPKLKKTIQKLFDAHADQKGIIHCHSYRMAAIVKEALAGTKHESRLIFHDDGSGRAEAAERHANSPEPTVIMSPSMSEGFDFAGDLARWQVIVKVPYPHLGDKQVAAKKDRDEAWYAQQAASSIIQACGRVVRSEEDWGVTYIVDSDFKTLYTRYEVLFPKWWKEAVIWRR